MHLKTLLLSIACVTLSCPTWAETPEAKGLRIAKTSDERDIGWKDMRARMRMVITDRHSRETAREIRNQQMEITGDGDKSLIVFETPPDVKGTAFLNHTHVNRPDDQWLFLKSIKRVKRISSNNKSGPFMGSEFAYEDISSQEVDKYKYKYLRDEALDGRKAFVVEQIPQYEYSGYKKLIVWIDQTHWRPLKIDFYDRKDALLKTLSYKRYKIYLNKYHRPAEMQMVTHQTGRKTTLYWDDYQFQSGLKDSDFDQNALKSAN